MEIIHENEYQDKVKSGVVLVDFFANWCAPCRMMTPILEEVAEELAGAINIYKVDVDEDEDLARKFGIMSIPTIYMRLRYFIGTVLFIVSRALRELPIISLRAHPPKVPLWQLVMRLAVA